MDSGRLPSVRAVLSPLPSSFSYRGSSLTRTQCNRGDALSLQKLLGHSSLDMPRRYAEMAQADVVAKHRATGSSRRCRRQEGGDGCGRGGRAARRGPEKALRGREAEREGPAPVSVGRGGDAQERARAGPHMPVRQPRAVLGKVLNVVRTDEIRVAHPLRQ